MPTTLLKPVLECYLFVSDGPLSLERLCSLLEEYERPLLRQALDELREEYARPGRGVELVEVSGGYQLRTRSEYGDYLKRLHRQRGNRFSQSALETLAIIAYRQPVTRAEVEYLRGVDAGGVIRTLLEKKLLKILGRKDIPGRPLLYGTSREFLELFGLKDLASLPPLKELQQLHEGNGISELQQELPLAAASGTEAPDVV